MEENSTVNTELDFGKLNCDQEEAMEAMSEFTHLVWECSQQSTTDEKLAYAQTHKSAFSRLVADMLTDAPMTEDDWITMDIVFEEIMIALARILNRAPESFREDYYEAFIENNDKD